MPALYQRAGSIWYAFLPNAPRRYAILSILNTAQHLDRKDSRLSQQSEYSLTKRTGNAALRVSCLGAVADSTAALRQHNNR